MSDLWVGIIWPNHIDRHEEDETMSEPAYCSKCDCELIGCETSWCIPCADNISGNIPTPEEIINYYHVTREYKEA